MELLKILKSIIIKQEVKFGENTRFDFLVSENNKNFIEVKNVTLSEKDYTNFRTQLHHVVLNI